MDTLSECNRNSLSAMTYQTMKAFVSKEMEEEERGVAIAYDRFQALAHILESGECFALASAPCFSILTCHTWLYRLFLPRASEY